MRVLHVAPSIARSYGGPTRSLLGYAAASISEGDEVTVAAPLANEADVNEMSTVVGRDKLHVFPAVGRGAFVFSPSLLRWVSSNAKQFDVIHVHGLFNPVSSLSSAAALNARVPLVIRPFGTLSRYTYNHRRKTLKRVWLAAVERRNVQRASVLHFTTDEERDQAAWHGSDIEARAHIVPPPFVAPDSIDGPSSRIADSPRIVFVGRLDPIKNLEALIDAWPNVLTALPNAELVIAGSGKPDYVRSLSARAKQRGIPVTLPGFLGETEKNQLLASASVFVLPSHHENFGIAALEAIAAGVPVLLSEHVQLKSFLETTGLGRVACTDPQSLAAAIVAVIKDLPLRAKVSAEGSRLASETFGIKAIGPRVSAMYLDAVDRHNSTNRRF